jgi:outer membrane protein insertion porin family
MGQNEYLEIDYGSSPHTYKIADIKVTGAKGYEPSIIIGFSGLNIGQTISLPGDEISNAIKRFWKQGLFDDVKITTTKMEGDQIWLNIVLKQRPKISKVYFEGLKKSQKEDLSPQINLFDGGQFTTNNEDQTRHVIK